MRGLGNAITWAAMSRPRLAVHLWPARFKVSKLKLFALSFFSLHFGTACGVAEERVLSLSPQRRRSCSWGTLFNQLAAHTHRHNGAVVQLIVWAPVWEEGSAHTNSRPGQRWKDYYFMYVGHCQCTAVGLGLTLARHGASCGRQTICTAESHPPRLCNATLACKRTDRLQVDEPVTTVPTIGFNVETLQYQNIKFQVSSWSDAAWIVAA